MDFRERIFWEIGCIKRREAPACSVLRGGVRALRPRPRAHQRGRAAKRPLVDRLRPDGRSVDLVAQVRGKRAVGRLARDQP
jgi:hypothetical protein